MKATGIVRRIDDLGRIVIPKEIRRTFRIREGDPLEIFTDTDGGIIFRKYSPVGEMMPAAAQYAEVLNRVSGMPVLMCDCDHVIAAAGVPKKEYLERRVTADLEELIHARKNFAAGKTDRSAVTPVEGINQAAAVLCPIVAAGDVAGAVVLLKRSPDDMPGETEVKLAQASAAFLGKQLEG